ncbi:DNA polymerase alpha/epsilon subunit B-domain-containing protein [Fimicolochytrium jonesii]|uniref:DNA polymerase alpha/epsilon subunit B-domain-containing protein n=1 Tax=Fimicolochytrium jonesii TaxID=1396493 RepID=UPI0022FEB806|nr:DNA polymerase alpha/epsilon subunit B-domain-containing protein [Fimicolochytrium jonesii]KAI8815776.1 DNA polymerase alpha/epsilon subunit B-domain-containing protein [Fimicolochytrium jonesii]
MLTAVGPTMFAEEQDAEGCTSSLLSYSPNNNPTQYTRHPPKTTTDPTRFLVKERNYTQQYAGIYFTRLSMLRPRVLQNARERWSRAHASPAHVPKLLDVQMGQVCYVVGTVYVDMPLKPNVLEEVSAEHWVIMPPPRETYASEEDTVILEDDTGRVKLTGSVLKDSKLVTGIVIGVLGCENANGEFDVVDICYPAYKPQPLAEAASAGNGDQYIAVASGLSLGDRNFDMELGMMVDYLTGELGTPEDQSKSASITRFILAGNSIAKPKPAEDEKRPARQRYGADQAVYNSEPVQALDTLLAELSENIHVDILPGETDPSNFALPQQSIHQALFPKAARWSGFASVTNPWGCEVGGVGILATSGQTLDDIFKYTMDDDRLAMARRTVEWAHVAPTAPDTLWCHPYKDTDPFIMTQQPHVYIIGNQPAFETTLVKDAKTTNRTRVILVPSFAETKEIVVVNLRTLEVEVVGFGVDL